MNKMADAYLKIAFCALSCAMMEAESQERWDICDMIDNIAKDFTGDLELDDEVVDKINDIIADLAKDIK